MVDPGAEVELEDHGTPATPKPETTETDRRLSALEAEVKAANQRATDAAADAKYWADRARGATPREPATEQARETVVIHKPAPAEEKPTDLLDDLTATGIDAIKKRGFATMEDVKNIVAEVRAEVTGQIQDTRSDAEFGLQLEKEFPEMVEDARRFEKGLPYQNEVSIRGAEIYREAVASDPALKNSSAIMLMSLRQARAEIKAKGPAKGGKTETGEEEDLTHRPAPSRRERIARQMPERTAAGEDETDTTPRLTEDQKRVAKIFNVPESEYIKQAGGGRRNGRR